MNNALYCSKWKQLTIMKLISLNRILSNIYIVSYHKFVFLNSLFSLLEQVQRIKGDLLGFSQLLFQHLEQLHNLGVGHVCGSNYLHHGCFLPVIGFCGLALHHHTELRQSLTVEK